MEWEIDVEATPEENKMYNDYVDEQYDRFVMEIEEERRLRFGNVTFRLETVEAEDYDVAS